jgi:hypothetical protein
LEKSDLLEFGIPVPRSLVVEFDDPDSTRTTNLMKDLETNFYDENASYAPLADMQNVGMVFCPTTRNDHLTTKFVDVRDYASAGDRSLFIEAVFANLEGFRSHCVLLVQNQDFADITEISCRSSGGPLTVFREPVRIPGGTSNIRVVLLHSDPGIVSRGAPGEPPAGRQPPGTIDRWTNEFTDDQWLQFIVYELQRMYESGIQCVVLLGSGQLSSRLQDHIIGSNTTPPYLQLLVLKGIGDLQGVPPIESDRIRSIDTLDEITTPPEETVFVAPFTSNSENTESFELVMEHPVFRQCEFIHKVRFSDSFRTLLASRDHADRLDELFVSSLYNDGLLEQVYNYSLSLVEQKCSVKDAYDIYQLILETRNVEGAVAEFGSYRGHSGLIISELLRKLEIGKNVYLCDTFESFPVEEIGIDRFWSNTHHVNFEEIKKVFKDHPNVRLIKGDFADTIDSIPENRFSFVYVDCDSYRAVRLVSEKIYPKLNRGGVIVYEDYGHTHCLGARVAVDRFYRDKKDCFRFFSFFSGFHIVLKTEA